MKRMSIPNLMLAALLALLPPLEQSRCIGMGLPRHAAPSSATACARHACCGGAADDAHRAQPTQCPQACCRIQPPPVELPVAAPLGHELQPAVALAIPVIVPAIAPPHRANAPAPSLGVWSPPLPDELGARGLRAPPSLG